MGSLLRKVFRIGLNIFNRSGSKNPVKFANENKNVYKTLVSLFDEAKPFKVKGLYDMHSQPANSVKSKTSENLFEEFFSQSKGAVDKDEMKISIKVNEQQAKRT